MSKKKILIGLVCLLLIGGIIAGVLLSKNAPEKGVLTEPGPGQEIVTPEPAEEPTEPVKEPEPGKEPTEKPVEEPADEPATQAIEVTVVQLRSDYSRNEISADQKYLNKTLHVSGKVHKIKRDILTGKPAVLISGIVEGLIRKRVFVKCVFKNDTDVVSMSTGQMIIVKGTCVGIVETIIRIENCSLVE